MSIRKLLVAVATLGWAAAAFAESTLYMERTVNLIVPAGHCLLGSTPLEATIRDVTSKAMAGYNQVLGVYGECREVERIRKGKPTPFSSFGQIVAHTPKGQPTTAKGMSRPLFISTVAGSPERMEDSVRRMKSVLRSRGEQVDSAKSLGVVKTDDAAAYLVILQDIPVGDGTTTPGAGVTGMTVVQDIPISINFYRRARGEQVIQQMLRTQSETLKKFVAANP
jgi:hypothetical protein